MQKPLQNRGVFCFFRRSLEISNSERLKREQSVLVWYHNRGRMSIYGKIEELNKDRYISTDSVLDQFKLYFEELKSASIFRKYIRRLKR